MDIIKYTSPTKEGNGGAEIVKKNIKIARNLNNGEIRIKPRINTNCRLPYIEYSVPTSINSIEELRPWNNMIIVIDWTDKRLEDKINIGIVIICATEE